MITEIIFDFDDTLYPTSALQTAYLNDQYGSNFASLVLDLKTFQESVIALLNTAVDLADSVKIITNASSGWPSTALKTVGMNGMYQFIIEKGIPIISAREEFKSQYTDSRLWKIKAFDKHVFAAVKIRTPSSHPEKAIQFIGFGDQDHDRTALLQHQGFFRNSKLKSVKLESTPTIKRLTEELDQIRNQLQIIIRHRKEIDVEMKDSIPTRQNPILPFRTR